jgi:hypothetical protein
VTVRRKLAASSPGAKNASSAPPRRRRKKHHHHGQRQDAITHEVLDAIPWSRATPVLSAGGYGLIRHDYIYKIANWFSFLQFRLVEERREEIKRKQGLNRNRQFSGKKMAKAFVVKVI